MSPTRRDLFRRAAATLATASIAALPAMPVAAQTPRLASLIDIAERCSDSLAAISGMAWIHWWKWWSPEERGHYLEVIEREFPDLTADVIDHLEFCARQEGAVR